MASLFPWTSSYQAWNVSASKLFGSDKVQAAITPGWTPYAARRCRIALRARSCMASDQSVIP